MIKKIFGLLLGLMVVFGFFLPSLAAKGFSEFLSWFGERSGREISVESVVFTWSGRGELGNFQIKDSYGEVLSVKKAVIDLGLLSLLQKNALINEVTLEGARLNLRRTQNGLNIDPRNPDQPSVPQSPEGGDQKWLSWVESLWKTWQSYRDLAQSSDETSQDDPASKSPETDDSPWLFGVDRIFCSDLEIGFEGHRSWDVRPQITLEGLGSSDRETFFQAQGSEDFPAFLRLSKNSLELKNCALSFSKSPVPNLSNLEGLFSMVFKIEQENLNGSFAFENLEASIGKDLPPLENFTLEGNVTGSLKRPRWSLSENSKKSIQKALANAGREKLIDEGEKRLEKALKDKLGDEAGKEVGKGLLRGLFK